MERKTSNTSISVIIPVFNTGKLLNRCLESLEHQTWSVWEAICVDDGSDDGITPELLDCKAEKDSRIKVFHCPNAGVSAARNLAMKHVTGNYVMFVDSDDFLHPQAMEICVGLALGNDSDIVAFTYDRKYRTILTARQLLKLPEGSGTKFKHYSTAKVKSVTTDSIFDYATEYSSGNGKWAVKHCQPWRCLYKTGIIRDIDFPVGIIYEDFPWWSRVLLNIRKATIINLPLYFYYPNFRGFIHSASRQKRIDSLRIAIPLAEKAYKDINDRRKELWEHNFLTPFKAKLAKKEKI